MNNRNELFHSDTYLGKDYSDGMRHFKYIKREKVNGKWRYIYSPDEYNNAQKNYNTAKNNFLRKASASTNANQQTFREKIGLGASKSRQTARTSINKSVNQSRAQLQKAQAELNRQNSFGKKLQRGASKAAVGALNAA